MFPKNAAPLSVFVFNLTLTYLSKYLLQHENKRLMQRNVCAQRDN